MFGDITMANAKNNSPRVLFMVPGSEYMAYQDRVLKEKRGCEIDIIQRGDIALDLTSRFRYDLIFAYIAGMPPGDDSALSKVYCGGLARLPDHVPTGDTFGVLCACIKRIRKEGKNRDSPILAHSFYD